MTSQLSMLTIITPWFLLLITALVVYALLRKIILERRLAALIRRQAHWRKQEEDAEYFEEVKAAVDAFERMPR